MEEDSPLVPPEFMEPYHGCVRAAGGHFVMMLLSPPNSRILKEVT